VFLVDADCLVSLDQEHGEEKQSPEKGESGQDGRGQVKFGDDRFQKNKKEDKEGGNIFPKDDCDSLLIALRVMGDIHDLEPKMRASEKENVEKMRTATR
jgi:hypothetical protein